jgi:hypothetical protein
MSTGTPRHHGLYEHRSQPLLPRPLFARRVGRHAAVALLLVLASLAAGTGGYRFIGGLSWVDAFLNAAMILGGMGAMSELLTSAAKVFAALYALYAGIVFLAVFAVLLAPFAHRLLHSLHVDEGGD